jgi:hypothetical protein
MKLHQLCSSRFGNLTAAFAVLLGAAALPAHAQYQWNGADYLARGNMNYNDNWYYGVPGFGFGQSLYFNYNNSSETSINDDLGGWESVDGIYWASTFSAPGNAITWTTAGNGFNFDYKIENDWSGAVTVHTPTSGDQNGGAGYIQLNPVAGSLTFQQPVYNDNAVEYQVYGGTANNRGGANFLILQADLAGGVGGKSGVDMNIEDDGGHYGIVDVQAAQTWGGSSWIYVNAGELWMDIGGGLASGQQVQVGDGSGSTPAKLWLTSTTLSGGINFTNAITVYQSGTVERTIGGLNTNGTDTFYSPITLNSPFKKWFG